MSVWKIRIDARYWREYTSR